MARLAGCSTDRVEQASAWFDLAIASLELGRVAEAIRAFSEAVAFGAGVRAETELAVLHALRGEPLRAADELRAIISRDASHAEARVHLASLLLAEGGEATVLRLLQPPPPPGPIGDQWLAQRSLALLRQGNAGAARVALPPDRAGRQDTLVMLQRLRLAMSAGDRPAAEHLAGDLAGLAEEPTSRIEHRIEAHFQLGALFDQVAGPKPALRQWQLGHRLLALAQPFSRNSHDALLASTRAAFGAARFARGFYQGRKDHTPVFIVGLPRSGTTLAEHILSAHPAVHGAGERMALLDTVTRLAGHPLDPATSMRAATLSHDVLGQEAQRYLEELRSCAPPGTSRIIDKMPANDLQLGFAAALLPGARIIHCTRDLRDNGLSIFRRRLSGYHPYAHDLADLGWWMRAQRTLMAHWRMVLPVPILEIGLSDWVRDFKGTLSRALDFLDLPYDPACETFHLTVRDVRTASRDQIRQPINALSEGYWRRYGDLLGPMLGQLEDQPGNGPTI